MHYPYPFRVLLCCVLFFHSVFLVAGAALTLSGTASIPTHWFAGGQQVTAPMTVNNTGEVGFACLQVDRPGPQYTMISGSASGWTARLSNNGNSLIFEGGPLPIGQSAVFNVTVQLPSDTQTNKVFDVKAGSDGSGPNSCNQGKGIPASSAGALDFNVDATPPTAVSVNSVTATSYNSITAVSGTSTDAHSGLNATPYFFDETTGAAGANDSDWQVSTTHVDNGLSELTQYCYRVKARDTVLNETSYSSAVCTTTPTPVVEAGPDEGFGFGYPVVFSKRAYVTGTDLASITSATFDWGDGTVENATLESAGGVIYIKGSHNYQYKETFSLKLCLDFLDLGQRCDTAKISIVGVDIPSIIGVPSDFTVTDAADGNGVALTWIDPSDESKSIQILRGISPLPVSGQAFAEVPVGVGSFIDTEVKEGDVVTYQLRATDGTESGELTEEVTFTVGSGTTIEEEEVEEETIPEEITPEEEVVEEEIEEEEISEESEVVSEEEEVIEEEPEELVIPVEDETEFIIEEVAEEEVGAPGTTTPVNVPGETVTQVPIVPTPQDLTPPGLSLSDLASGVLESDRIGFTGVLTDRGGVVEKVKISLDGGASTFPVNSVSGLGTYKATFTFNAASLTDGNYDVVVYSEDNSGNLLTSEVYEMVVDRYDPYIGSSYLTSGVLGLLPDEEFIHQSAVGLVQDFYIPVGGGATEVQLIEADKGITLDLIYVESVNLWKGSMSFDQAGWWNFEVHAKDGAGNEKTKSIESIYVHEDGSLTSVEGAPLNNYKMSIFVYNSREEDWQFWDAQPYNQINPYYSGTNVGLAFTLPAGKYYFTVEAEGYRPLTSQILELSQSTVVTPSFSLEEKPGISEWPVLGWLYGLFDVGTEAAWEVESIVSPEDTGLEGEDTLEVGDAFPAELLKESDELTLYTVLSSWNPFGQEQLDVFSQMDNETLQHLVVLSLLETDSELEQFLKRGLEEVQVRTDEVGYWSEYIEVGSSPYHILVGPDGLVLDRKVGVLSEEEIDQLLQTNVPVR